MVKVRVGITISAVVMKLVKSISHRNFFFIYKKQLLIFAMKLVFCNLSIHFLYFNLLLRKHRVIWLKPFMSLKMLFLFDLKYDHKCFYGAIFLRWFFLYFHLIKTFLFCSFFSIGLSALDYFLSYHIKNIVCSFDFRLYR